MSESPPPSHALPSPDPFPVPPTDEELLAQCRVETFRAGGPGGQHQNTSDTGVRLVHEPTGLRVVARGERSQLRNRKEALRRLRERLEERGRRNPPRRKTAVPSRERRKRLEAKRRRAEKKRTRRAPPPEPE